MSVDPPGILSYVIATRQKRDLLFSTSLPLGLGAQFQSPVRRIQGYAELCILAVSDQPFEVQVYQATDLKRDGSGHFVQTPSPFGAVATGPLWLVCQRVEPCGNFAKMIVKNTGPGAMLELSFSAAGLPC